MGDSAEELSLRPPAIDPKSVPVRIGSSVYPKQFRKPVEGRSKQALGDAVGLRNFGVNLTRLAAGAWSSIRHWHTRQDEFIYVLEGEITLVTDDGEQVLGPGMVAGFPAGTPNGHHLINRGSRPRHIWKSATAAAATRSAIPTRTERWSRAAARGS